MTKSKISIDDIDPIVFNVNLNDNQDRLDCAWFNPVFDRSVEILRNEERPNRKLVKLGSLATIKGGKKTSRWKLF